MAIVWSMTYVLGAPCQVLSSQSPTCLLPRAISPRRLLPIGVPPDVQRLPQITPTPPNGGTLSGARAHRTTFRNGGLEPERRGATRVLLGPACNLLPCLRSDPRRRTRTPGARLRRSGCPSGARARVRPRGSRWRRGAHEAQWTTVGQPRSSELTPPR